MKKRSKLIGPVIAILAVAFLIAAMIIVYINNKPATVKGSKNVLIKVIGPDEETYEYRIFTDAEYLGDALRENDLVKGETSEYGFFITEIKGIVADSTKNEYWMLTKKGEYVNTGVDLTPVYDGDEFEFTFTKFD